ncbi:MAG: NAD-dependent epimerase/dehydratase family protein [Candidatus Latescibacterota bacterium]
MSILVTGSAGFIGYHTCLRFLHMGYEVVGLDHINAYYDVELKRDRLKLLEGQDGFLFVEMDLNDMDRLNALFKAQTFEQVIHLAAQAGVPYSLENPKVYVDSNVSGFLNVLECCRHHHIKHLIYASSSSVYGQNTEMPFSTQHPVDHPVSLYAATKRANELMAHAYSSAFGLPTTGLRFFTVYGPWGRPDIYNQGKSQRSFTYVDDVVEGIVRLLKHVPRADETIKPDRPDQSSAPFRLYNIGNDQTVVLEYFISVIEGLLDKQAQKNYLPMRTGDVPITYADIDDLEQAVGYRPATSIEVGIEKFVKWYREYYGV